MSPVCPTSREQHDSLGGASKAARQNRARPLEDMRSPSPCMDEPVAEIVQCGEPVQRGGSFIEGQTSNMAIRPDHGGRDVAHLCLDHPIRLPGLREMGGRTDSWVNFNFTSSKPTELWNTLSAGPFGTRASGDTSDSRQSLWSRGRAGGTTKVVTSL